MRLRWVLNTFLAVISLILGLLCLVIATEHWDEFVTEEYWRNDGYEAVGVVTGLKDGWGGRGMGARFGRLAVVRIEGSDGVRYEALMDPRDVGLLNSEVDVVYLTESDPHNTPDPGYVMAQARPRTPAYLSYNPAFALAKAAGAVFTGIFLFCSIAWLRRNASRSDPKLS